MELSGVEAVEKLVTIVGAPVAAVWALLQWRASVNQRKREHRWRQAELGHRLLYEYLEFPASSTALEIIDGECDSVTDDKGITFVVVPGDLSAALTIGSGGDSAKARHIRYCFDSLFYFFERLENSIRVGLIDFDDIVSPTNYYVGKLASAKSTVLRYLKAIGYQDAICFLDRFACWRAQPSLPEAP